MAFDDGATSAVAVSSVLFQAVSSVTIRPNSNTNDL